MHVADTSEAAPFLDGAAQPDDPAAAGAGQAQRDLELGRLAGPVGTQQGEDMALRDGEAHPAQGLDRSARTQRRPVGLGDVDELGGKRLHHLIRAICTPFCKMPVKPEIRFADIWSPVPVMIWLDGKAVLAL